MRYDNSELCNLLAAEYELGTLIGPARKRFERLLSERPDLAEQVDDWRATINRMAAEARPVEPPPEVWQGIRERIDPRDRVPVLRWWERLGFWRSLALGNGLLVAVLAVVLLVVPSAQDAGYMAVIKNEQDQPVWMVDATEPGQQLHISNLSPVEVPEDKYCVLWLRAEDSGAYYRLGALPEQGDSTTLQLVTDLREMISGQLVVSLEDSSASVGDEPVGTLEYQGQWMTLNKI